MNRFVQGDNRMQSFANVQIVPANKSDKGRIISLSTLLIGTFLLLSLPVSAQEFSMLAGPLFGEEANTYSWIASYREGLGRFAAWSRA